MTDQALRVPRGAVWAAFLILWVVVVVGYNALLSRVNMAAAPPGASRFLSFVVGNGLLWVAFALSAVILRVLIGVIERSRTRHGATIHP
jgi:hypothetical protein